MSVDYDFGGKMKENRQQWGEAGISTVTFLVPDELKNYFKALTTMMCAEHLLEQLEKHDPALMSAFANRQPRSVVTYEELDDLINAAGTPEAVVKRATDLIRLMREKRQANSDGNQAIAEGDELAAYYHMAREYAITHYIRGAHAMMMMQMSGGMPKIKDY